MADRKLNVENLVVLDEKNLHEYQMQLLAIARDVIAFFDKHHLAYSLSGGSILGAIRHKGFIPWDDDIDLNVPREDYDRMVELFDDELGEEYYLQTPHSHPELGLMVTQIRKKGTIARRKYDWNTKECGISIDIYIIENVYDDPIRRGFQKWMSMGTSFAVSAVRFYNNRELPEEIQELEGREYHYPKSKLILGSILHMIPLKRWIEWCDYWNSRCKNKCSKLVAIPTGRKHFSGEIYERKKMCVFKKVPFETEMMNVPIWAEGYLQRFFGDYQRIPPVKERERHIFLELKY